MRLALITDRFGSGLGGAERYLRELAAWLVAHGDEPVLFSMDRPPDFPCRAVLAPSGSLPRGFRERRFARRALEAAKREGCSMTLSIRPVPGVDFFQPHGGAMDPAWQGRGESKEGWRRGIWSLGHFADLKFKMLRDLERETMRRARRILPVSQRSAEQFRAIYPERAEAVQPVPLGVDLRRFSPRGETASVRSLGLVESRPVALFVAQDFELKGLRPALDTIRALRAENREICLLVLGEDRHHAAWERRIREQGLENAVRFLGLQPNPAPWYRAANILLHPTFFDPCARVVLESLACGLPVVTTTRNGAWRSDLSGIEAVQNPRDDAALAAACRRMLALAKPEGEFGFLKSADDQEMHFRTLREEIEKG